MKARVRINKAQIDKKLKGLEQVVEDRFKDELTEMARFVTMAPDVSPVDTGAYVTSFSIKPSYSSGRGRTSRNKPTGQNDTAKRNEGFAQLMSDIEKLEPMEQPLVVLSNGSPHALSVERGSDVDPNWNRPGYAVFARVRNKFR